LKKDQHDGNLKDICEFAVEEQKKFLDLDEYWKILKQQ
jgi:hypothetical protein